MLVSFGATPNGGLARVTDPRQPLTQCDEPAANSTRYRRQIRALDLDA
jgi:hypothetical protein